MNAYLFGKWIQWQKAIIINQNWFWWNAYFTEWAVWGSLGTKEHNIRHAYTTINNRRVNKPTKTILEDIRANGHLETLNSPYLSRENTCYLIDAGTPLNEWWHRALSLSVKCPFCGVEGNVDGRAKKSAAFAGELIPLFLAELLPDGLETSRFVWSVHANYFNLFDFDLLYLLRSSRARFMYFLPFATCAWKQSMQLSLARLLLMRWAGWNEHSAAPFTLHAL